MYYKKICFLILASIGFYANSQTSLLQKKWVESEFKKLSDDEKIAQLFIIRTHSNWEQKKIDSILAIIKKYNVGGICFFQGDPINQAIITNQFQQTTKTPLLISIDAEWGLGMRLNNVINFPKNMQLGAIDTTYKKLVYRVGENIASQCKRLGIQLNYAPVADINNNPYNPVINDRSFGEDKYKVSMFATQLMQGLQDNGVMACAKHFPGHGDVNVDSHFDLPQINKTLDSLYKFELFPFKTLIDKGIQAVMVAHLFVPSIDTQKNKPSSLSENTIQQLLKKDLKFNGLVITDALEMNAIKNYYPDNTAATQAIIAGNDLLCLPGDIDGTIKQVKVAIKQHKINWQTINLKVKKILNAKYQLGLYNKLFIDTTNILQDINLNTASINKEVATKTLTVAKLANKDALPIKANKKYLYLEFGNSGYKNLYQQFKNFSNVFYVALPFDINPIVLQNLQNQFTQFDYIFIGLHNFSRKPQNNFNVPENIIQFIQKIQSNNAYLFCFGNPYFLSNFSKYSNAIVLYEDNEFTQEATYQYLIGNLKATGILPVSIPKF